jgi:pyruvate formate lyase activating enzyme
LRPGGVKVRVHSIETLGALDGPGIRTVVFFKGCPMRCAYCHNADALSADGGTLMSAAEIAAFAVRYKSYYGQTGGVTLSGGEPLMQADAALALTEALKAEGIHTALDTSGCIFAPAVLDAADLVILDVKHTDPQRFFDLTEYPADGTFKTLEYLKGSGKRFWVRQVIVNGFTDGGEQIKTLIKAAAGAEKTELLPFHNMGAHKWAAAGLTCRLSADAVPSAQTMARLNGLLRTKQDKLLQRKK